MPERIRIEQTDGSVRIADSTGTPLQEITIGKAAKWGKDGLNVVRDGRRGKMTQTLAIEQDGRVLVIRTKTESNGQRPSREFKRVYRRISA